MADKRIWFATCKTTNASWAFPFSDNSQAQNYVSKLIGIFRSLPDGLVRQKNNGIELASLIWRIPFVVSIVSIDRRLVKYMLVKYDHGEYVETRRFSNWRNAVNFVHQVADELEYQIDDGEDSYGEWNFVDKNESADEDTRFKLFIFVTGQNDNREFINHCYKVLDVQAEASDEVVKRAYKKLIMKTHPDHGGNEEDFKIVQEAYAGIAEDRKNHGAMSDMVVKAVYDAIDFKLFITNMANEWFTEKRTAEARANKDSIVGILFLIGWLVFVLFLIYGVSQGWKWSIFMLVCMILILMGGKREH